MLVVLIGFAAIAGLAAGYLAARLGGVFAVLILWAVCVLVAGVAFMWSQGHEATGGYDAIVVFYGIVVPFVGCAIVSGLLGLVARATILRSQAE